MAHRVVDGPEMRSGHPFGLVPITGRRRSVPSDTIVSTIAVPATRRMASRPRYRTVR